MRALVTARVARRMVRQRRGTAAVLLLVGFLVSSAVAFAGALVDSSETAVRVGLEADHAGRPYSVQAGKARSARLLAEQPGIEPVRDQPVALVRAGLRTTGLLRVAGTDLPFGVLLEGRRPRSTGEVTVSEAIRLDLGLDVGDELGIESSAGSGSTTSTRSVVGVTVDPADRSTRTVVGLGRVAPTEATIWLASADPYANPALTRELDLRAMTYTPVASVAEERRGDLPPTILALRHLPLALGLLLGAVGIGILGTAAPRAVRDATALQSAGLSPRQSWRAIVAVASACVIIGEVAGLAAVGGATELARHRLGALFGQYWTSAGVPTDVVVAVLGTSAVLAVISPWLVRRVHARVTRRTRFSWRVSLWTRVAAGLVLATGAVLLGWAALGERVAAPEEVVLIAPGAAVVVGIALPIAASGLVGAGCGAATTKAVRIMLGLMLPAVVGVAALTTVSGVVASRVHHQADVETQRLGTIQAPGSLLLHEVPDDAAAAIVAEFEELGGSDVTQFLLPDERTSQGRVTQPGVIECVRESKIDKLFDVPLGCYDSPSAPVSLIAASAGAQRDALAAPDLIRDGKVGILRLRSGTDQIESAMLLRARPDPALTGDLPGLVVPRRFGPTGEIPLSSGGTRMVVLRDFGALSPVEQSRMRATVARLASAAQVLDSSQGDVPSRRRSAVAAGSLAAAAIAFAVMLMAGVGAVLGSRRVAGGLDAVGAGPKFRRGLVVRLMAVPVVSLLASIAVVALSNTASRAAPGTSFGPTWPVPAIAATLALVLVAPFWLRVSAKD